MDYFVTEIPRLCGCQALLNMNYYGFWRYTNFVLLLLLLVVISLHHDNYQLYKQYWSVKTSDM